MPRSMFEHQNLIHFFGSQKLKQFKENAGHATDRCFSKHTLVNYYTNTNKSCDNLENAKGVEPICISSGTTSFLKTTFNGLNSLSGVGILSIPYALSCGGWLSLLLLLIIAIAALYTGLLIQRCMDADGGIRSYPDIGERPFGARGRAGVSVFMNLELFLVATGFLILAGDNLYSFLPHVELRICGATVAGGRATLVLVVAAVMAPTVWIDSMAALSFVSATGVVASVVILGSVLWSGMGGDGVGFSQKGELLNWSGLPTALSLYAFCYCAHPVFPTLYTSMTHRSRFSSVMESTDFNDLVDKEPWLSSTRLVVKPDMVFGKRGKSGLVALNLDLAGIAAFVKERLGKEVEMGGCKGPITTFIDPLESNLGNSMLGFSSLLMGEKKCFDFEASSLSREIF